tara:strand:- start:1890 stop:2078 length:189 start_codon:yes stop_codon:yes gene_type:complete
VTLLAEPTILPSSKILIAPGINPPPIGTQYLLPGNPGTATSWYCTPAGTGGLVFGSAKLGSA